jgi:hypothetical protein
LIVFGGANEVGPPERSYGNGTTTGWTKQEDSSGHPAREFGGRWRSMPPACPTVLFGGKLAIGFLLNDIQPVEYDGNHQWRQLAADGVSAGRRQRAAMWYVARHCDILLFGGRAVPRVACVSAVGTVDDLWEWNGTTWRTSQHTDKHGPSPRRAASGCVGLATAGHAKILFRGFGAEPGAQIVVIQRDLALHGGRRLSSCCHRLAPPGLTQGGSSDLPSGHVPACSAGTTYTHSVQ